MRRGWWFFFAVAAALFGAGVVWAELLGPYLGTLLPSTLGWADAAQIVSAIAASIAAIAASKAASKSAEQVELMRQQSDVMRTQSIHQSNEIHRGQFDRLVLDIEQATGIRFVSRWQLYGVLFPNSQISQDLEIRKGKSLELEIWRDEYRKLSIQAHESKEVGEVTVIEWIQRFFSLTNSMRLQIVPRDAEQARDVDEKLAYGITKSNLDDAVRVTGIALDMLSSFCGCNTTLDLREPSLDFKRSVKSTLNIASRNPDLAYS